MSQPSRNLDFVSRIIDRWEIRIQYQKCRNPDCVLDYPGHIGKCLDANMNVLHSEPCYSSGVHCKKRSGHAGPCE